MVNVTVLQTNNWPSVDFQVMKTENKYIEDKIAGAAVTVQSLISWSDLTCVKQWSIVGND